ncbi:L-arabinose transport system permease protein AraP [Rhodobacteraceae bacterium THAF1]|uniref:carbohydrate ABC transporter permease n=1 Tax=Palleronia sp. THAF1 TaxID=2587842 RepID=UPI000F3B0AC1|nr:sugar ABC transporter permease [Palleronia sp. THAF1]QFU07761.1 L-arabinose transport system permease protein AraP [Palleronia sp. THAF1]VDC25576.1 L-arabinose transport system permease protein AraP [Rhodobacteraceae bacterium THAF1]
MSDATSPPDRRLAFKDRVRRAATNGRLTAGLILLPPALILFTLFVMLPLGESGMYAFYDWNGYGTPEDFVGLRNFEQMLGHSVFSVAVWNTVKIVLISLLIQMPLALLLALMIYKKTPTNAFFRLIFFVPYIMAEVAAGLIWSFVFDGNYGVTASIAATLGIDRFFVLADRDLAFYAVMVVIVWKYFGFHMMIYIAALQGVPDDQIEAAQIEGATRTQVVRHVQIPHIKPAIAVSAFFAIIGALQVFDVIIPLTNGGPSNQTHTIVTYLYEFGLTRLRIGYGSAVGVVLFVVAVLVAVFYQRIFMKKGTA